MSYSTIWDDIVRLNMSCIAIADEKQCDKTEHAARHQYLSAHKRYNTESMYTQCYKTTRNLRTQSYSSSITPGTYTIVITELSVINEVPHQTCCSVQEQEKQHIWSFYVPHPCHNWDSSISTMNTSIHRLDFTLPSLRSQCMLRGFLI